MITRSLVSMVILSATALFTQAESVLKVDLAGDIQEGFLGTGYTQTEIPNWEVEAVTNSFPASSIQSSGTIECIVSASTSLMLLPNRGVSSDALTKGEPEGFTYTDLYKDVLYAGGSTGYITLSLSGLNPNQEYDLSVFVFDGVSTDTSAKEWSIIEDGVESDPQSILYSEAITDDTTFALDFHVISTDEGTITVRNTSGFSQAVINGFTLSTEANPVGDVSILSIEPAGDNTVRITCNLTTMPQKLVTLKTKSTLISSDWNDALFSSDGVSAFASTNLSYATTSDSNVVIYAEMVDSAAFFTLEKLEYIQ